MEEILIMGQGAGDMPAGLLFYIDVANGTELGGAVKIILKIEKQ